MGSDSEGNGNPVESDSLATKEAGAHLQIQGALMATVEPMGSILPSEDLQEDENPSDSISNVPSNRSAKGSENGGKSIVSTTSSACIKAEADLAALMAWQQLLQERHALEEQKELKRKHKEKLKMEGEIIAHMAKLSVLRAASTSSTRGNASQRSIAINLKQHEIQGEQTNFNVNAFPFIQQRSTAHKQESQAANSHEEAIGVQRTMTASHSYSQPSTANSHSQKLQSETRSCNVQRRWEAAPEIKGPSSITDQNSALEIMKRQNEITTLLIQQQQQ